VVLFFACTDLLDPALLATGYW